MLKTIYNLFKKRFIAYAFQDEESKKQMIEYVFKNQAKPKELHGYKVAFIDSQGRKYYRPESEIEFGIGRLSVFMRYNDFLKAGVSQTEIERICDAHDAALEDIKAKASLRNIARVQVITEQLRELVHNPAHEELLLLMSATFYIREDENPYAVDSDIEAEKVEEFKKHSKGELFSFFYQTPLKEHFDLYGITESNLEEYLKHSRHQAMKLKQTLELLASQKEQEKSTLNA